MLESLIPVEYYRYVYLFLTLFLVIAKTVNREPLNKEYPAFSYQKALILGMFFILYFGLRSQERTVYMTDTANYVDGYNGIKNNPDVLWGREYTNELVWTWLQNTMATLGFPVAWWLTAVAAIYILPNVIGARRLFPNHAYLGFLFYVAFFLFYSGGTNGIRNADAYSLVFLGMTFLQERSLKNYLICAILCLLGFEFHSSVYITIFALILSLWVIKRTDVAIVIWIAAIIVVLLTGSAVAQFASQFLDDDRAVDYIASSTNADMMNGGLSQLRFRWDFLLFSALPILIGWYVVIERQIKDRYYIFFLNTYILANAIWVVFMYASFSNRFAMLSWCIYPYVLCYPLIKCEIWRPETQNINTCILLWIILGFTYYMAFV